MGMSRRMAVAGLAAAATGLARGAAAAGGDAPIETLKWDRLLAPGWDPRRDFDALGLERMEDGDPAAERALARLRETWDRAPANPALDGRAVRLWGYMQPVDADRDVIRSFLLVPYFGACVHEPSPPSNQVVWVEPARPFPVAARGTSAVWAAGRLEVRRVETGMGVAGYRLVAADVAPYGGEAS